jgi:hypothetical protein
MSFGDKLLAGLAKLEHQTIEPALLEQAKEIEAALQSATEYQALKKQLGLLSDISFRVPKETVKIVSEFLKRIQTVTLTYEYPSYRKFDTKGALITLALGILHKIRYQELNAVLVIFLEYASSEIEDVKKEALRGLELTADWNIDVLKQAGYYAQDTIIKHLQSLKEDELKMHFSAINLLCREILSTTISGDTWRADSVIISRGAIKADVQITGLRKSALQLLEKLYSFAKTPAEKIAIIGSLQQATNARDISPDDKATVAMLNADAVSVLKFYQQLLGSEELEIIEDIEHNAYWTHYHKSIYPDVKAAAIQIRDLLDANEEYQIFKTLIGFQGIFEDWESEEERRGKFKEIGEYRDNKAKEFVAGMTPENFALWRERILEYAKIESNDMATFPHFSKFLEHFGVEQPALALKILKDDDTKLERFLIPVLSGLWKSDRENAKKLIRKWMHKGLHLGQSIRLFSYTSDVDNELLQELFKKSQDKKDPMAFFNFTSVAAHQFGQGNKQLVSKYFVPSVKSLTELNEVMWIFDFWYRQNSEEIIESLTEDEVTALLDNLVQLKSLEYHAENVLSAIAKKHAIKVITFFGQRIERDEKTELKDGYEPVPYQFYKLASSLATIPKDAVGVVRSWYKPKEYGMFSHRGGRLLSNIFPTFSRGLSEALINLVQEGGDDNWLFVMSVLRNYEGQPFIHDVCRELAKVIPEKFENELGIILDATGVVSGPLGFAEAYERKIKEVEPWLKDTDEKVRTFAERHIKMLGKSIEHEKIRAAEEKELREYQFRNSE